MLVVNRNTHIIVICIIMIFNIYITYNYVIQYRFYDQYIDSYNIFLFNHSFHTAGYILEEGKDNVKSSWPLWAGLHTCYNGSDKGKQWCESERILKNYPSSDCSLQFENMKVESLVIVDQHATVNLYLSLVLTARHALEIEWIGRTLCFIIILFWHLYTFGWKAFRCKSVKVWF